MASEPVIGRITATEKSPTTTQRFVFWLKEDVEISPFDIIKTENKVAGKKSTTFGVITDIFHITDCPSYLGSYVSSDFGDVEAKPLTDNLSMTYAEALVLHNSTDSYMPVLNGSLVRFADSGEVASALGLDKIKNPISAGYIKMSNGVTVPIKLNADFLIGGEGAHLNISGISGLATKTSYAMFILQAIQQKFPDCAIIIMNVKGKDLLCIDELSNDIDKHRASWELSELEPKPFSKVKYFYPLSTKPDRCYCQTYNDASSLSEQISENKAFNFVYTYEEDKEKLDLLFSNIPDQNFTMESILNLIIDSNEFRNLDWNSFKETLADYSISGQEKRKNKEITVQSWRKFERLIRKSIRNDIFQLSIDKNKRDIKPAETHISDEIKNLNRGDVMVVDIAKLEEQLQCLVFGDVIRGVYNLKLGETQRDEEEIPRRVIIFVDELNKYASSDLPKDSPILNQLLEITERGRSMGIILFSAEQFKSGIHDRVKGNCSTHIYGKTNAIELGKSDYRYIDKVYQNMMTRLNKGELIIQHPVFRSLLKIKFPMPAYKH